ncbi:MAG: PD40 domain-containing protein [Acidobacteriota bacterium]|nr:MAG: PD40 domain-containing protein [Acidobacteriota bacterium]
MRRRVLGVWLLVLVMALTAPAAQDGEAHLMRYADVHDGSIVFTYEDDLWLLEAGEQIPRRLTRHAGSEALAKFSPDGSRIAFTAQYDGGVDVYVMDARGGVPSRLTWHPSSDRVLGWTPDGAKVLFRSNRLYPYRAEELYVVPAGGGVPKQLAVDRAGLASLAPDGQRLAYNRISREERTWKRHQGGTAQDIWIGTLGRADFRPVTRWEGTDNYPMWVGEKVFFTSDRNHGTLNLFSYDVATGSIEPLTDYRDYDVKYPSDGPGQVVFQYGESLHLLDIASGAVKRVPIRMHSDRVPVRAEYVEAGHHVDSFRLSPDGSTMLLADRGELLLVPVKTKDEPVGDEPVHLTRSSGSREKDAVYAPDGTKIAFISDETGEEEIWLIDVEGPMDEEHARQLTSGGRGFRMPAVWSPDSDQLLFADKFMRLQLVDVSSGRMTEIDRGEYDDGWYRWGIQDHQFSPDGRWIAYTKMERSLNESLFLYDTETNTRHRVTGPETTDWSPSFDPKGRYLYFLSSRTLRPTMGQIDQTHIFLDTVRAYLVLLDAEAPSPFGPASAANEKDDKQEKKEESNNEDQPIVVEIDIDGIEERILVAEGLEAGNYFRLEALDEGFLVLRDAEPDFLKYEDLSDESSEKLELVKYDLDKASSEKLIDGINNYHLSADRKKLVYRAGDLFGVVDAGGTAKVGDGKVDLESVTFKIHRLEEFLQIFDEAWRVQRDWFYDPKLHGVDWDEIKVKYRRFVPDCGNRSDLNYLIGEMIGELNAGHTYVGGGDIDRFSERVPVGLLGADLEWAEGAPYPRIAHIVPGVSWDPDQRSPLREPGCEIAEGDYLVAIDGRHLEAGDNPLRFLEQKVGKSVEIRFSRDRSGKQTEICKIRPIGREAAIRYREWVEDNRRYVEKQSGGKIAYIHLPDMMQDGLIEFARAFYSSYGKQGLIIDDRYNTGGFVGDMIIDRLERKIWALTKPREGRPIPMPERCFHGHFAVLVNADTGSNGEYFAEAIKIKALAPIIGERTWGGAVGIEPHQDLVDGAVTTPPQFAPYGLGRRWLIEGRGVEPDIPVGFPPSAALAGEDPQLDKAIEILLQKLEQDPRAYPEPPSFPVKKKP